MSQSFRTIYNNDCVDLQMCLVIYREISFMSSFLKEKRIALRLIFHVFPSTKPWKIYDHIFSQRAPSVAYLYIKWRPSFPDLFAIIEKLYPWMIYWHHIKEKSRTKIKSNILTNKVSAHKREKNFSASARNQNVIEILFHGIIWLRFLFVKKQINI